MSSTNGSTIEIHQVVSEESPGPIPEMKTPKMSVFAWLGARTKSSFRLLTGPAAGPLIFTCVCVALAYRKHQKGAVAAAAAKPRPKLTRSVSMAALHGGKAVIDRLIESHQVETNNAYLQNAVLEMQKLLGDLFDDNSRKTGKFSHFSDLNKVAARLEMTGQEEKAIEMLRKAIEKAKKDNCPHELHELEMLLVEMLIYKGNYQEAKEMKCLKEDDISDARGPLYLSIIYTILGDKTQAKNYYDKFKEIRGRFHCPGEHTEGTWNYHSIMEFDEFEKLAKHLKEEIEHAHSLKV